MSIIRIELWNGCDLLYSPAKKYAPINTYSISRIAFKIMSASGNKKCVVKKKHIGKNY